MAARVVSPDLLADAKRANKITWKDVDTDAELISILRQGMAYIDSKAGVNMDYDVDDLAKSLLMDYSRYARAGARNQFENDYISDITTLSLSMEEPEED